MPEKPELVCPGTPWTADRRIRRAVEENGNTAPPAFSGDADTTGNKGDYRVGFPGSDVPSGRVSVPTSEPLAGV